MRGLADIKQHALKKLRPTAEELDREQLTPDERDLETPEQKAAIAIAKHRADAREESSSCAAANGNSCGSAPGSGDIMGSPAVRPIRTRHFWPSRS